MITKVIATCIFTIGVLSVVASFKYGAYGFDVSAWYWLLSITFFVLGIYCMAKGIDEVGLNA